jgi:hypothetical protein
VVTGCTRETADEKEGENEKGELGAPYKDSFTQT